MTLIRKSFAPAVESDIEPNVRKHLLLLYQTLGNHSEAFNIVSKLKTGSTTTSTPSVGQSVSYPVTPPPSGTSSFLGQGYYNDQSGVTSYATTTGDNGILLVLNDASPVAVTLTTQAAPYSLFITNFGAGTATLTPSSGTINGGASLSLLQNQTVLAVCNSTNWRTTAIPISPTNAPPIAHEFISAYNSATGVFTQAQPAYSDLTGTPTLPATASAVAHEWLSSYNATTGAFTLSQPAFTDVSGQLATGQLPVSGLSVTITTAKLTSTGANGSMTFTNGLLTAQVQAT